MTDPHRAVELEEAIMLVRYAAGCLNETERASVVGFAEGLTQETIANQLGCTQSAVAHATKTGLKKLRYQMERMGIRSIHDLISEEWRSPCLLPVRSRR